MTVKADACIYYCYVPLFFFFGQASCTLEAGVRIYSLRVDSVHSDAYKVLARMNRAGQDTEKGYYEYPLIKPSLF